MYGGAKCLVLTPDKRGDADRQEGNNPSNRLKQNVVCRASVCLACRGKGQVGAALGVLRCTALWCPVDRQVLELLLPAVTSSVEALAL